MTKQTWQDVLNKASKAKNLIQEAEFNKLVALEISPNANACVYDTVQGGDDEVSTGGVAFVLGDSGYDVFYNGKCVMTCDFSRGQITVTNGHDNAPPTHAYLIEGLAVM